MNRRRGAAAGSNSVGYPRPLRGADSFLIRYPGHGRDGRPRAIKLGRSAAIWLRTRTPIRKADSYNFVVNLFEKHLFVGKRGSKLPFRLLRPKSVARGERYPLVIFLHGAGERGSDNSSQLKWCVNDFAAPEVRERHSCFVAAPQCPKGGKWVDTPWDQSRSFPMAIEPSASMRSLIGLIDRLERELPIDANRIYPGGLSMGGYGVWDLLARQPKRFAAAFPICGGGDPARAKSIAHVPLWVFHGAEDEIVPVARSQEMVDALQSAGARNVRFSNYPGVGHHSWLNAFAEPELFNWLFSQRRS